MFAGAGEIEREALQMAHAVPSACVFVVSLPIIGFTVTGSNVESVGTVTTAGLAAVASLAEECFSKNEKRAFKVEIHALLEIDCHATSMNVYRMASRCSALASPAPVDLASHAPRPHLLFFDPCSGVTGCCS